MGTTTLSRADGLSRFPLPVTTEKGSVDSIFNMAQIQSLPVTAVDVQKATRSDRNSQLGCTGKTARHRGDRRCSAFAVATVLKRT